MEQSIIVFANRFAKDVAKSLDKEMLGWEMHPCTGEIVIFVGNDPIWGMKPETRKFYNNQDFVAGYRDAKNSTYDRWYRYNRANDGKIYDAGWKAAEENGVAYGNGPILQII